MAFYDKTEPVSVTH